MARYLLINPWIYDFAAYDFGIKPVGLLRIAEYIRRNGNEVYLIDCLDGCGKAKDTYGFSKIKKEVIKKPQLLKDIDRPYSRYGISKEEFLTKLENTKRPDKIFVTSGMTYWYPAVQETIGLVKKRFKNIPVVLGGIYATLCYEHACSNSGADIVHRGEYLKRQCFFQDGFYPAYDLLTDRFLLPIQLSRGCPFRCSYCASGLLCGEFRLKKPAVLFKEIDYYHNRFGARNFVFYDDALAYRSNEGLKSFLRIVTSSGKNFIFHTPNGLHAKYVDEELAALLKEADFKNIRLSLETSDISLQKKTGAKVTNKDLTNAIKNLKAAGFNKQDIGVYILMGAPWLRVEKTMDDIMFINSLGAKTLLASYSLIPGTKDYIRLMRGGVVKEDMDPLWHNKSIFLQLLGLDYLKKAKDLRGLASCLNKKGLKDLSY